MRCEDAEIKLYPRKTFRITHIISETISVYYRNIGLFTFIGIAALLPGVFWSYIKISQEVKDTNFLFLLSVIFEIFVENYLYLLIIVNILYASFLYMINVKISMLISVRRILPMSLNILIISLFWLPISVFFYFFDVFIRVEMLDAAYFTLILMIPMMYLAARWYVSAASCVIEGIGPLVSLARSRDLTRGLRGKIFLLVLGSYILIYAGSRVVGYVAATALEEWGQFATMLLWLSIIGALDAVSVTVTYYYLRGAKEGADVEQFAAVFD